MLTSIGGINPWVCCHYRKIQETFDNDSLEFSKIPQLTRDGRYLVTAYQGQELLCDGLLCFRPAFEACTQVLDVFESKLGKCWQRTAATSSRASMHDVGLAWIQCSQLVGKAI